MDKFHELLELVDKNATRIPEGDYIKMCNIIKHIHKSVKPPPFLLDATIQLSCGKMPSVYNAGN